MAMSVHIDGSCSYRAGGLCTSFVSGYPVLAVVVITDQNLTNGSVSVPHDPNVPKDMGAYHLGYT